MDPLITSALIGGGANLLSGGMGFFGGGGSEGLSRDDQRWLADFQWKQSLRNEHFQRNYVQLRSRDAEKAGIHPLAALGIQPAGFGQAIVGAPEDSGRNRWDNAADMTSRLGQDISRAVSATATPEEKLLRRAQLATEIQQARAMSAEADLKLAQARDLERNPSVPPVDPGLPFNPVAKMKKGIGHVRDGIIGPESRPFWKAVGRGVKRSFMPWRKD